VLDFIEGPDPVLHMLCHEIHAHAVPISSRDLSEQQESHIEELGVTNWVSGKALKQIMRRYGAHSTRVQPINSAKIFKTQQVDVHAKRELERQISELKYQLQEHQQRVNEITAKRKELVESFKDLQNERQKIDKAKAEAQSAVGKYHRAEAELETAEESLLEKQQAGAGYKQRVESLDAKIDKVSMKRAEAAIEFSVSDLRYPIFCSVINTV
jgi:chromosome segregation ATPase